MNRVRAAFEMMAVVLPLSSIHPIRQITSKDNAFGKYHTILASIREIGLVEPLAVYPQKGSRNSYVLLDGHMRLKALQELGHTEAFCLISEDDDAFTYNDKVSRIPLIQEHAMIMRAVTKGVTPQQIAKALAVDVSKIKSSMNLLDGIHAEAVELLKNKPISAAALRLFRKAKAIRQIDMAQLMVTGNNFTHAYAKALIIGTPAEQLANGKEPKVIPGVPAEEIARMEKEMESIERDYRLHQDQLGENALHLNATQRYVKRLLENPKVRKFLVNRYPEIFDELQELVALEAI
ncbi:MAG: plasmid partitioning protein RepB C-terminal domain-containing protein [Nibricoccus sp.]